MSALQAECQRFESVNLHKMRCSSNGKTIDSKPINVGSIPTQRAIFPYLAGAYAVFKSSNPLTSTKFRYCGGIAYRSFQSLHRVFATWN